MGNPGDTFHIRGLADERHYHDKLEQKISNLKLQLAELRAEWDEFIAAMKEIDMQEPAKDPADLGQIAYEAYCEYVGWKSVRGEDLPGFSQQEPRLQNAWRVAAGAVLALTEEAHGGVGGGDAVSPVRAPAASVRGCADGGD